MRVVGVVFVSALAFGPAAVAVDDLGGCDWIISPVFNSTAENYFTTTIIECSGAQFKDLPPQTRGIKPIEMPGSFTDEFAPKPSTWLLEHTIKPLLPPQDTRPASILETRLSGHTLKLPATLPKRSPAVKPQRCLPKCTLKRRQTRVYIPPLPAGSLTRRPDSPFLSLTAPRPNRRDGARPLAKPRPFLPERTLKSLHPERRRETRPDPTLLPLLPKHTLQVPHLVFRAISPTGKPKEKGTKCPLFGLPYNKHQCRISSCMKQYRTPITLTYQVTSTTVPDHSTSKSTRTYTTTLASNHWGIAPAARPRPQRATHRQHPSFQPYHAPDDPNGALSKMHMNCNSEESCGEHCRDVARRGYMVDWVLWGTLFGTTGLALVGLGWRSLRHKLKMRRAETGEGEKGMNHEMEPAHWTEDMLDGQNPVGQAEGSAGPSDSMQPLPTSASGPRSEASLRPVTNGHATPTTHLPTVVEDVDGSYEREVKIEVRETRAAISGSLQDRRL